MLLSVAFGGLYAAYSVRQHHRLETHGFDLGIFEQVVRGYASGGAPVVDLKGPGVNALGDHFHPIVALLAVAYRLVPQAETLLVAQAVLIAVSVAVVGRAAWAVAGPAGGASVTVAYGLSWGLQETVAFDFHEVSFAVPLLALALTRLLDERWTAAVAWAAPLVLVKEDLPLTVAAIGGYLVLRGQRRLGTAVVLGGVLSAAVIVGIVMPAIAAGHGYAYVDQIGRVEHGLGIATKLDTLLLVLVPTLFVALRSPLLLVAVPTLGWRFLADNPNYWGDQFHYSAPLMPIVFVALLDGLRRCDGPPIRTAIPAWCLAFALALAPTRPLWRLTEPALWRDDPASAAVVDALRRVPDGATVAATNAVAVQLTGRCRVTLLGAVPPDRERAEWVAADLPGRASFLSPHQLANHLAGLRAAGYRDVVAGAHVVILRRQQYG